MRRLEPAHHVGKRRFGVLEIGSSKICCVIVEVEAQGGAPARAIGFGHTRSHGIKSGVVVDLGEAEQAVRAAVAQAERAAGVRLETVHVAVACGRLCSRVFTGRVNLERGVVDDRDIESLYRGARSFVERDGRSLVHLNRLDYVLDDLPGIREPRGMAARQLAAELHAVTADEAPLRNLLLLLERCELGADSLVPSGLASALSATSADERRLGVTCVDIGGGVTTVAMFAEGHFVHTDAIPVGGKHVTFDIARDLITPLAEAERIKTLYGTLAVAASDEHERFAYPGADETEPIRHETTKARLGSLVRQRYAALLELVRERVERSPAVAAAGEQIVITGGAGQMLGLAEFAANVVGRPVRIARPAGLQGMPGTAASPSLAAVIGLVEVASGAGQRLEVRSSAPVLGESYLGKVERWLRESF